MDDFALWALIIGILSTASLPLGSILGMTFRPRATIVGALAAFGGGALLAALSVELVAPTMMNANTEEGKNLAYALLIGGILGGVFFWILDQMLNAKGGYLRKTATAITFMSRSRTRQMATLLEKLSTSQFFRSIPPDQVELLIHRLKPVVFNPSEVMFREGTKGESLYVIETGRVALTREGREIGTLSAGDIIGEIALLTDQARTATAKAIDAVKAMELSRGDFETICKSAPFFANAVRELAGGRLEELGRKDAATAEHSIRWASEAALAIRKGVHVPTPADLHREAHAQSGAALAIWLGITLDGIPECFVLGATVLDIIHRQAAGGTPTLASVIPYTFLIGLILSNVPEALSSSVGMLNQGWKKWKVLMLWMSLVVIGSILTMVGFWFGEDVPHWLEVGAEGMAAGAMLTMIAQTMIPEAVHLGGPNIVGLSTLAGFLMTVAFKLVEG